MILQAGLFEVAIVSPWKLARPVLWTNLNTPCFLPSLIEIGSLVLDKKILNVVNVFSQFRYYFTLVKDASLDLNKLESSSSNDACNKILFNWPSGSREGNFLIRQCIL